MNTLCSQLVISTITAVLAFASSLYLARKKAKAERSLLIEEYGLQKGKHICDIRFDEEFAICKDLSEVAHYLSEASFKIFPQIEDFGGNAHDLLVETQKRHHEALEWLEKFKEKLYGNAPFLTEALYEDFWLFYTHCEYLIQNQPLMQGIEPEELSLDYSDSFLAYSSQLGRTDIELSTLVNKVRKHFEDLE
ncbi:hypothetical protein SAMN06298221_10440 [Sphaerochaeta associata]|uniref:Uncharacterized protein n=1 Tax=Sphaerochaeta associata TaxID=1129264 RepID=A0ABY4DA05_9SPIR|nr:hypothetical protein [Sphaerochaeta associata]UOM49812.1 hypothetical protein MUG09_09610 [Sphaerochaeta associata]SMP47681.1 hypothetical protein SAMN06298221_10440 [Sphaerochaeta associata]